MNIDQLDQEITLHLQSIDSDLSYCFNKITKEIIPYVTRYGQTCEEVMNSSSWLKEMFQQSANVQLVTGPGVETAGKVVEPRASIFPEVENDTDDFHTGEQFAGVSHSNGTRELHEEDTQEMTEDSAMEKQRKKRKVSLQIQQRYNSSSSDSSLNKELSESSSPIKMIPMDADRGTETSNEIKAQLVKPGTVIHFNSKRE